MAKQPAKNAPADEEGGYINIALTEEQRAMAREWCATDELLFEAVQALLDTPFTMKVGIEPKNNCYACYLSGHWHLNKFDRKWTLTGRGSTAKQAIRRALYIHFQMLDGNWKLAKTAGSRTQDWD